MSTEERTEAKPQHGRFTSEVMAGGAVVEKFMDQYPAGNAPEPGAP